MRLGWMIVERHTDNRLSILQMPAGVDSHFEISVHIVHLAGIATSYPVGKQLDLLLAYR
jgi:hypothetical protein